MKYWYYKFFYIYFIYDVYRHIVFNIKSFYFKVTIYVTSSLCMLCVPNQKGQHCRDDPQNHVEATRAHCINHIPYTMLEQKHGNVCLPALKKIYHKAEEIRASYSFLLYTKCKNICCYIIIIVDKLEFNMILI